MAKVQSSKAKPRMRPASTPEAREKQLVSLAVDLAEQQLMDGTASSQVLSHFLKLGTSKNELELEKLRNENLLLKAKTEALESAKNIEALYKDAISAMQRYSGAGNTVIDTDYDEY